MKTMIVVVVMVLLTLEIGIAAAYSFSPGLQHALSDGLGKTRFSDMSNIDKTGWEDFGFALKRIDEESDKQVRVWASKNEGKLVEAKIIVLANDYAHRPEIYDHFRKKYMLMPVTNDKVGPVLPKPPSVLSEDKIEEYRLVFEGALLGPRDDREYQDAMLYAAIVIGEIGSKKSFSTFDFLARVVARQKDFFGRTLQSSVAHGLLCMPSNECLENLIACLSYGYENRLKEVSESGESIWKNTPFSHVLNILKMNKYFEATRERRAIWKAIIAEKSYDGLDDPKSAILEKLKESVAN